MSPDSSQTQSSWRKDLVLLTLLLDPASLDSGPGSVLWTCSWALSHPENVLGRTQGRTKAADVSNTGAKTTF